MTETFVLETQETDDETMPETTGVVVFFPKDTYGPYELCKAVNKAFLEMKIDKELPPQMFYTYAKKGMLGNAKDTKIITQEQAAAWFDKYLQKNVLK